MATRHLSPYGFHQALLWLGLPTAIGRSSSKVSPGFWKASAFPVANVCRIYTRGTGAISFMGTAAWEGPECVPTRGFKSLLPCHQPEMVPTDAVWTRRWLLHPSGGQGWSELCCLLPAHRYMPGNPRPWRRYGQHWGTVGLTMHHVPADELSQK